jgi:hypothetical protein
VAYERVKPTYSLLCWNFGSYLIVLHNRTGSFVNNNNSNNNNNNNNNKGLQFTPNSLSCISSISIKLLNGNTNYVIRIRCHEKYCFIHIIPDAISIGMDNGVSCNFITY